MDCLVDALSRECQLPIINYNESDVDVLKRYKTNESLSKVKAWIRDQDNLEMTQ